MVQAEKSSRDAIGVEGAIWTSHGGALLAREQGRYRVLKTFPPSIDGNRFSESLPLAGGDHPAVCLLVHGEDESRPQPGQTLHALPTESRLYECSNASHDMQQKPLKQGDER